ncbi:Actin cross-linking toxin VgrG1 [Fundidesulfovibrio magnetotacticus]|uniref:Actin cross-linking toxin VgrG1 n=1 Tax=Fundidesulfovibrio magnetotacticus TaxID=2730080 RepID=A0A6V8M1P7_9BACT|nr:type VI secretion system tip protein TssI/VgrG [Fundidesulfovibrio magnetotacticus]GFK95767.1 Actin cross-linking toxin VgrG1 [Fundidesulfovibrio magnetotacticus]
MPREDPKFRFEIQGFPAGAFHVARFEGEEGLSALYRFDITLVAQDPDLDFDAALAAPAVFTIARPRGDIPFHGVLERFELLSISGKRAVCRAVLRPRAWWLTQSTHNQIFLDMAVPGLLEAVFADGGLRPGLDFAVRAMANYPAMEYVCQYGETHFAFASRWMEHSGLYFFFEQGDDGEVLTVTDTATAHVDMPQGARLLYSPVSSLPVGHEEEVVTRLEFSQTRLPRSVHLRDYNPEIPSLELEASAPVSEKGMGERSVYGMHFVTRDQGRALARMRAQSLACREKLFQGESAVPFLRPGYTFAIAGHPRKAFNEKLLAVSCRHEGSQTGWLAETLGHAHREPGEPAVTYRNRFTAIPASTQFRAAHETPRPRIAGALPAKVDAEGSGHYAEVDAQGRYKVRMPFDVSGRGPGHASAWVRMAQPYAGAGYGMHMPLHKGAEVLVSFLDGDPDRPVITGAVPNPETKSPVTQASRTQARIATAGGNRIHFQDKEGAQSLLLSSPTSQSFLALGAQQDDGGGVAYNWNNNGVTISTAATLSISASASLELITGVKTDVVAGFASETNLGGRLETVVGLNTGLCVGAHAEFAPVYKELRGSVVKAEAERTALLGAVQKLLGNKTIFAGSIEEIVANHTDVRANADAITSAEQRITGTENSIVTLRSELVASADAVTASCNEAIAARTATLASSQEVATAKEEVAASVQRVQTSVDEVNLKVTKVETQVTELSGTVTKIVSNLNII